MTLCCTAARKLLLRYVFFIFLNRFFLLPHVPSCASSFSFLFFYVWPFFNDPPSVKMNRRRLRCDGGAAAAEQIFFFFPRTSTEWPKTHDSLVKREKSQCSMAYCSRRQRKHTQSVKRTIKQATAVCCAVLSV